MALAKEQAPIWNQLLYVWDKNGGLRWRKDIEQGIPVNDNRIFPERMVYFCCGLGDSSVRTGDFDTAHLRQVDALKFRAVTQESAGVNGILRVADLVQTPIVSDPKTLLIGAIAPDSIYDLTDWLRQKKWFNSKVTLVDISMAATETVKAFVDQGFLKWSGGIDVVKQDVSKYNDPEKFDLIIGDLLNPWMTGTLVYPQLYKVSPYRNFELMLRSVRNNLGRDGVFLSRCLVLPETFANKPISILDAEEEVEERFGKVKQSLGPMAERCNAEAMRHALVNLFDPASHQVFCWLELRNKHYQPEMIMRGAKEIGILRRLHNRYFEKVDEVVVYDETNENTYISFICN